MEDLAPIVLFIYNRPWHTQQTLEALDKNYLADKSILFIYADGAKENASEEQLRNVEKAREVARSKQWCEEVHFIERDKNWGLADNIVDGVTTVVNQFGKVIVLEDDIVTSSGFLKYMNTALNIYKDEEKVMHISGYVPNIKTKLPETFFFNQTSCWGWATWRRAWENYIPDASFLKNQIDEKKVWNHFNLDGYYNFYGDLERNINSEINTWAIKWHTSVYLKSGLCLHPKTSLVNNIGFDGTGTNCGKSDYFKSDINDSINVSAINNLEENQLARKKIVSFYKNQKKKKYSKIYSIKKLWLNLRSLRVQ